MSSEKDFGPERTENILNDERPTLVAAESSTDSEEEKIVRTQTGRSTIERQFEPINAGDREELQRIASSFGGSAALSRTQTAASGLERRDTLAGVKLGDPVLDPENPEFDVYKWTRM
jgi:ATP-binding cassette subfamily G (WHITE) protein 2 (PDR)